MSRVALAFALAVLSIVTLPAQRREVPHRVVDTAARRSSTLAALLADVARADVVFVGEQPDHVDVDRIQLLLLEGLAERQRDVIVALEVFDRDVQDPLEHFMMGHLTEADFLAAARPGPRYGANYKPLVDFAIAREWPIVAANAPRALVAEVVKSGLEVLTTRSDAERATVAREVRCPTDDGYATRVQAAVPSKGAYFAECLRDETMGETIAQALTAGGSGGRRPLVVSVNAAFRSEFSQGVVERTRRRLPDKRLLVISIVPVQNLDAVIPDAGEPRRADYLVYVRANQT